MAGYNLFNMSNYGSANQGGSGLSLEEEIKRRQEEEAQAQKNQWLASAFAPKTISEAEAKRLENSPIHIIEKTITPTIQDERTSVNPHGNPNDGGMGVKEQIDPYTGRSTGFTPTPGTVPKDPNATDAPAGEIVHGTHEGYTKQLDSSFLAAALQSSIPEDRPATKFLGGGGAHGGGDNLADMQQFLTGERRKKKNPALWRYSNV